MKLGIVVGRVVSTRKDEKLVGSKLLITQPISPDGEKIENTLVAVDTVGAGTGETVLYVNGSVASRAYKDSSAPVDAAIVAIVDTVDLSGK